MKFLRQAIGSGSLFDRALTSFVNAVVIFAGFAGLVVMFINIVGRYFFSYSLVWAEEFARYCLIVLVYFGASITVQRGQMLKVDIVVSVFPKLKTFMHILEIVLGIAAMCLLFKCGLDFTTFSMRFGEHSAAMNWLPMWIVYAILPVGSVIIGFRYFQNLLDVRVDQEEKEEM